MSQNVFIQNIFHFILIKKRFSLKMLQFVGHIAFILITNYSSMKDDCPNMPLLVIHKRLANLAKSHTNLLALWLYLLMCTLDCDRCSAGDQKTNTWVRVVYVKGRLRSESLPSTLQPPLSVKGTVDVQY
jgi:hypothetical protein